MLNIPHCLQHLTVDEDTMVNIYITGSEATMKVLVAAGIAEYKPSQYSSWSTSYKWKTGPAAGSTVQYGSTVQILIPAGTEMQITQMYIRNKGWAQDSITFRIVSSSNTGYKSKRITVLLADANKIPCTLHPMK